MFKCRGLCTECGRCKGNITSNDKFIEIPFVYPEDFRPSNGDKGYGLALDLGTTTVVGILWDLERAEQVASYSVENFQCKYGADVISRITFATKDEGNLKLLQEEAIGSINCIIDKLCDQLGLKESEITSVALCGNTTMSHIIAGYNPRSLAFAPFQAQYEGSLRMKAEDLKLSVNQEADVTVLPNIAVHVGGDIVAGLLASRAYEFNILTLFIDFGTNGEIVLVDGNQILTCSTAAGPAFEGASIKQGMRGTDGAISGMKILDDDVQIDVIGDGEPIGICGSGLIDIVAELLGIGILDASGRMVNAQEAKTRGLNPWIIDRLVEVEDERGFVLTAKAHKDQVVITQSDIRQVQLAKGAIRAGIELLVNQAGRRLDEIKNIIIAGAFGNYIDKEKAVKIGLWPQVDGCRTTTLGNSAGAGISMVLTSEREMKLACELVERVNHVELAKLDEFQDVYIRSLSLGQ